MKTIHIYKAQGTGDQQIESVTVVIDQPLPNLVRDTHWLETAAQLFLDEARMIVAALHSLPGGTLDRVLVELLREKVSQHIVPWEKG